MKLLNSDKIVDFIDKHSKAIDEDYEKTYTLDQIQEYLDAMPADYDVDSVVTELTKNAYFVVPKWESDIEGSDVIDLVKAIEIVKAGAKND